MRLFSWVKSLFSRGDQTVYIAAARPVTDLRYGHVDFPFRGDFFVYLDGVKCGYGDGIPGGNGMAVVEANAEEGWVKYHLPIRKSPEHLELGELKTAAGDVQILFASDHSRREFVREHSGKQYVKGLVL